MARPKSTRAHDAVIAAAATLFAVRGLDATSMDAIAAASGVSKATIYKHWPDKAALCFEVMAELHGFESTVADTNTGSLRADLLAVMSHTPPERYAAVRQQILPQFMAYAASNPGFGRAWRARVLEPARAQLVRAIERAIARGELPASMHIDFALGLLQGPPMYWYLRRQTIGGDGPVGYDPAWLVDAFLRAQGAAPQAHSAQPRPEPTARPADRPASSAQPRRTPARHNRRPRRTARR